MPRVVHFEISADEPERALKFYKDVFGWESQRWDGPMPYWFFNTGAPEQPGINGGMCKRSDDFVNCVNSIDVESVDEYVARIEEHGGAVVMPKTTLPKVGYLAYCKDTEGNFFGIMQADAAAQ
ncbi:MAG TPA: VOC family protein [Pyrinomonadaceae bacterium]|jgi:predicted enzyme related to lactoylglutathione lyase|nr:VOC family protein [Pyrinomonadaceae bacterium]